MTKRCTNTEASVCICTYNGAARIGMVLEALASQTQPFETWEVLIIDNCSSDNTVETCLSLFRKFGNLQGHLVSETCPGLAFARARAAREAKAEIICFLDDDNIPSPNWVQSVIESFVARPKAGVIGGKVLPRWESKPTKLAEVVAPFALAICDLGEESMKIDIVGGGIVGAGLCVRTDLLKSIYAKETIADAVSGRRGNNLMCGEDLVISIMAKQMGWECWYIATMQIAHFLPAKRMHKDYLLKLYEGIGRGQASIRRLFDWKARSPAAWLIGLKDFIRWQFGQICGPSSELRRLFPTLANELHELEQRTKLGRAGHALSWRPRQYKRDSTQIINEKHEHSS